MSGPAKLIGQKEPVQGQEIVCAGPISVGRDPTANSFPLNHASISRKHGRVFPDGTHWVVEDLNSSNGTFINDVRIQRVQLKDGDVVRFGDIPFKFQMAQAQAQQAAASSNDGFEPTMMMAGGVKGLQKPEPSQVPSDFEGTVFGGNAAAFFANQIQKGAQQASTGSVGGGSQGVAVAAPVEAPPRPDVPNVFMLKMKAIIAVVAIFGLLGATITFVIIRGNAERKRSEAVKDIKVATDAFSRDKENRTLQPEQLAVAFTEDLAELDKLHNSAMEKLKDLAGSDSKYTTQLKDRKEKIEFWIFERKLHLAVEEGQLDKAVNLAGEWQKEGTENQKQLAPLAQHLVKFLSFKKEFLEMPNLSKKAPDKKRVSQVEEDFAKMKEEYGKISSNPLASETYFMRTVTSTIDNEEVRIAMWREFWKDWDEYEKEKDATRKKVLLDKLKREYQNIDKVTALK